MSVAAYKCMKSKVYAVANQAQARLPQLANLKFDCSGIKAVSSLFVLLPVHVLGLPVEMKSTCTSPHTHWLCC